MLHVDLTLDSFFTDRTIVAEPLAEDMDEEIKSNILTRRKEILSKVSTDFAENCIRFAKKQQELDELVVDSTDIFKSNIIVC